MICDLVLIFNKMAKVIISDLITIFKSGVSAVLPENLIRNSLKYNSTTETLTIQDDKYDLQNKNLYIVGAGKAVQNMARETEIKLGSKIKQGIISIPDGTLDIYSKKETVQYFEGAKNNLPDCKAELTSRAVNNLVHKLEAEDVLLVLISGGGSALLSLPKRPINLEEKTKLIKKLANSGADIQELNTVRKKLSDVKGGRLAVKAQPAKVISLILSDIVGDPLDFIASGPTMENKDQLNAAKEIINKYNLLEDLPDSIIEVLEKSNDREEFPIKNVKNYIIGSNKLSIRAAVEEASSLQYLPVELTNTVVGNVDDIAHKYAKLSKTMCNVISGNITIDKARLQIYCINIPGVKSDILSAVINSNKYKGICLILGGEITVEVKGLGEGGRNQHLALQFSNIIQHMKTNFLGFDVFLLSAGTDGIDGPTDAAGAIGYLGLVEDAQNEQLNAQKYLNNNDSYNFYKKFNNGNLHVITGHTNTNVMDLHVIIIKKKF